MGKNVRGRKTGKNISICPEEKDGRFDLLGFEKCVVAGLDIEIFNCDRHARGAHELIVVNEQSGRLHVLRSIAIQTDSKVFELAAALIVRNTDRPLKFEVAINLRTKAARSLRMRSINSLHSRDLKIGSARGKWLTS